MVDISRVRVEWDGDAVVGGGLSTFYTTGDPADLRAAINSLFDTFSPWFPASGVSGFAQTEGEVLNSATGALVGTWSDTTVATFAGSGEQNYASGVGARCVWGTGVIARGRRVRGSTFMVPICADVYDVDGTLASGAYGGMVAAAAAFASASGGDFVIWTRPSTPGGSDGGTAPILSGTVPDKVSWLRSRRT
jgi:hypothetical protein